MTIKRNLVLIVSAALLLAACGGGGGKVTAKKFASACAENSNMEEEICSCLGEKSMTQLDENGRALIVAGLSEDEEGARKARTKMKPEELMAAGMFMVSASADCAADMSRQ